MADLGSVYEYATPLNEAEAPPPFPLGQYRATVQAVAPQVSKSSGKPMAVITYLISPDEYPADFTNGNPDGETFQFYLPLADEPRNRFRLRKFCEMHRVTATRSLNLPDFIGQEVLVDVTHEEYQGETRARVTPARQV